jgi:uncharacterized PurR-regulated membrane protein YhhQ (DUF165 family)
MSFTFGTLISYQVSSQLAAAFLGVFCFGLAFLAVNGMEETYGKDLDYQERD